MMATLSRSNSYPKRRNNEFVNMSKWPHRPSVVYIIGACCCIVFGCSLDIAVTEAVSPASNNEIVAVCHFETSDFSFQNAQTAKALTELVQAELESNSNVNWVERDQIELAFKELGGINLGLVDPKISLQLGKWVKADLLIKGVFSPNKSKKFWRLDLEFIDLDRADVLLRRSFSFGKSAPILMPITEKVTSDIVEVIAGELPGFAKQREQTNTKILIAPLYFQNTHKNSRLDFLEQDIQGLLSERNRSQSKYRYLQFPGSQDAFVEAELAVSGIVQSDQNQWQRIADHFFWANFQELDSTGVPFQNVEVEFTLWHWNGGSKRGKTTIRGTVGEKKELISQVVSQIESIANKKQLSDIDEQVREVIAKEIYARYLSQAMRTLQTELQSATHVTQRWLRYWEQAMRRLSAAAFFDPINEEICRELLIEKTRDDRQYATLPNHHHFWWLWHRDRAWARYCETYGFDFIPQRVRRFKQRPGAMSDNRVDDLNMGVRYVSTLEDVLDAVARELRPNRVQVKTTDVSEEILKQWHSELAQEYLTRLQRVLTKHPGHLEGFERPRLSMLRHFDDSESKARLLEMLWPGLIQDKLYTAEHFDRKLETIYADLGKPNQAQQMLAAVRLGKEYPPERTNRYVPPRKRAEPSYRYELSPVAPIREVPTHPQSVDKWWSVRDVTALTYSGGRVWAGFSGSKRADPFKEGHALFTWDDSAKKWLVWKKLNRDGTRTTSMLEQDGYLWLTFVGEDVTCIELDSGKTRRFSDRDGMPSQKLHASCRCGNALYFAGGEAAQGVLGVYDLSSEQWAELDLGQYQIRGQQFPIPCVKELAGNSKWLAVYADHYGSSNQILMFDQKDMTRVDVGKMLKQSNPEFSHFSSSWRPKVHSMTFVEGTLWIATSRGLLAFDPNRKDFTHVENLQYELTSLASDGKILWFGACPYRGNGTLGDTDQMTCVFMFDTVKKEWLAHIPVFYPGHLMNIARNGDTLWLGTGSKGSAVVAVDISALRPNN